MNTVNTLTVVTTAAKPKKPKLSHRAFDDFVADLDCILNTSDEINETLDAIANEDESLYEKFRFSIMHTHVNFKLTCAKCEAFEEMYREGKYDEVKISTLKQSVIVKRLALLINSFPNNGPKAQDDFVALLLEEVTAFGPSVFELEGACRQLVRTVNFVPSIAEVLAALREQRDLFQRRFDALEFIEYEQDKLRKAHAELMAKAETTTQKIQK